MYYFILSSLLAVSTSWMGLGAQTPPELDDLPFIPAPNRDAEKRLYRSMLQPTTRDQTGKPHNRTKSESLNHTRPSNHQTDAPRVKTPELKSSKESSNLKLLPTQNSRIEAATVPGRKVHQESHSGNQQSQSTHARRTSPQPNKRKSNVKKVNFEIKRSSQPTHKEPANLKEASRQKKHRPEPRRSRANKDWRDILKHTTAVPGLPESIRPTPRGDFRYYAPEFYRGIYLNNGVVLNKRRYLQTLKEAKAAKVNVLVVDVQPRMPHKDFIKKARLDGFYLVARVVVFPGGLESYPPPAGRVNHVVMRSEEAAKAGFMEIQLDYIRFTDYYKGPKLSLSQRYRTVTGVIKKTTDRVRPYGVRIGADIFGRIPFNKHDKIGQKLEVFAPHLDTIYPMLYPSHFYGKGMANMRKYPYRPVYQGTKKSIDRVGHQSRIIAWIQSFKMSVAMSGLSYVDYIHKQMEAAKDAGGAGFVAWNAGSHYGSFYKALKKYDNKNAVGKQVDANQSVGRTKSRSNEG